MSLFSDTTSSPRPHSARRYRIFGAAVGLLFAIVGSLAMVLGLHYPLPVLAWMAAVIYLALRLQFLRRKHPVDVRAFELGCMLTGAVLVFAVLGWLFLTAEIV